jgi:uncharacterized spore protein YtfJ
MEDKVQGLLDALAELREKVNVNAVFGEPVTAAGRTVIPVARVGYHFEMGMWQAAGSGEQAAEPDAGADVEETGGDGSGGMRAVPLAIVVVTEEGTQVKPIVDEQKVRLAAGLLAGWVAFWMAWTITKILTGRPSRRP